MADVYKIKIGNETHNLPFLPLSGGTMTGNITLGSGNAIIGSGNSIPAEFKDAASINPEVHSVWLAAVGTGTNNTAGTEASGILFDGNTIKMWSPLDNSPLIIDSDNGAEHILLHSGNITKDHVGLGNVNNTADADKSVNYANSAGSAPASDVYSWAKAANKPSYKTSEVTEETNLYFTNKRAIDACSGTYLPFSGGTLTGALTFGDGAQGMIKYATWTSTGLGSYPLMDCGSAGIGIFARASKSTDEGGLIISEDTCVIHNSADTGWNFQIHNTDLNQRDFSGTNADKTRTFGIQDTGSYAWSRGGYKKDGSSDSYVLLGGGGHKAVSDFLTSLPSHTHTKANITDFPTSMPASDVYSWAKASSKPSYAFNEISAGNATIGNGANQIFLRTDASWGSTIYHHTTSDEAVVFLNKGKNISGTSNYTTSWIFAYGTPADRPAWNTLTPALQIKGECVAINKLIGSQKGGSYNLDVSGSANATTLYENGTRVLTSVPSNITVTSISASSNGCGAIGASGTRFTYGYFNNAVYAAGGFFESSDERLKDIQAPLTTDLEKLSHLRKVYFNFKEDPSKTHIGVIAQDVKELYPEIVTETDEGTLNVDYSKLSVIALDAVDQLNNRCNELEEKLNKVLNALNL